MISVRYDSEIELNVRRDGEDLEAGKCQSILIKFLQNRAHSLQSAQRH